MGQPKPSFADAFRESRRRAGFRSADRLAAALINNGVEISGGAIRLWEQGRTLPNRDNLRAAEKLLGTDGDLAAMLDYADPEQSPTARRLDEIERRLAALESATSLTAEAAIEADPDLDEDGRRFVLKTLDGERRRSRPRTRPGRG